MRKQVWQVDIHLTVTSLIQSLPRSNIQAIYGLFYQLQQDPRVVDGKPLYGFENVFETFVGNFRIVYQIQEEQKRIAIVQLVPSI